MRIHVLGHRGMLGQAVCRAIERRNCTWVVVDDLAIQHLQPRRIEAPVVINCAGVVKGRDECDSRYMYINGFGPQHVADVCDMAGARLIHISTDCVFKGPGPHLESSAPDATDIYARSKLAGEVTRAPHLTVRTSFIGWGPRGLLAQLLAAEQAGEPVKASRNLRWTGHTVDTVADVLVRLAGLPDITGLLHLPARQTTRYDLVRTLAYFYQLTIKVVDDPDFWADRRLISERWDDLGLGPLPMLPAQLERMPRP